MGAPELVGFGRLGLDSVCFGPDHYRSRGGEGVFEARALRGEHLAAVFCEVPVVFEADTELSGNVDAGLVREAHSGGERGGIAADKIRPFVAVHADTVSDAVGEVFVVGAVAGGGDDIAGGFVDGLALHAGVCGG